ncbi:MAG: HD-GYP domain-containing protein [Myxococcota bacterium]
MSAAKNTSSIFSQKLDRVAFTAYFLGAVVPLVALAFVTERFVLPTLADRPVTVGLIALILSIGSLSLGSFFVLRRTTREALARIDGDNRRLGSLLKAAGSFGNAQYGAEAAATAVRCALELSEADAVYAFVRGEDSEPPSLVESLGQDAEKELQRLSAPLSEQVDLVLGQNRPALREPATSGRWKNTAAAVIPLAGDAAPIGALVALKNETTEGFAPERIDALTMLAGLASVSMRNTDLRDAQRNFFAHMTELLVTALDAHLLHQNGHGDRTAQYANRVARELGLDEAQMERLHFAALLHDVGMLKIERSLLINSKACEKHPVIGARMLERILLWKDVAPIVLHHHEWFDGSGYPEQLAGEAIPLESRIITVCEAFDVMVSSSSYKIASDAQEALRELADCSGTQFDPDVVAAFTSLAERGIIDAKLS